VAVAQGVAHAGRRELLALAVGDRLGHRDREAVLCAIGLHQLGAAGAAPAERDVEADGHVLHGEAADQHLLDELAVAEAGHLEVERQQVQQVHAQGLQRAGLLGMGHQLEGRLAGAEQPARVRVEGDHAQRQLVGQRGFRGLGDHLLVAAMHAVEIAQGHAGAPLAVGQVLPAVDGLQAHADSLTPRPCAGP
jgi:hypothetical protein